MGFGRIFLQESKEVANNFFFVGHAGAVEDGFCESASTGGYDGFEVVELHPEPK